MRNNKIRWGAGFVLGTASVAVAWGDVREDLTIRYGIWDTAYRKHDVLTLASLLHSKFVLFTDTGKAILDLLHNTNRDSGITILMATHSEEAAGYASRIIRMRDGKVVAQEQRV